MMKWVLLPFVFLFVLVKRIFFIKYESEPQGDKVDPVKFKENVLVVITRNGKKEYIR